MKINITDEQITELKQKQIKEQRGLNENDFFKMLLGEFGLTDKDFKKEIDEWEKEILP